MVVDTASNSPASNHLGLVTHAVVMTHLHEKRQSAVSDRRRRCLLLRTSGRWLHHLVQALAHLVHLLLHVGVHHHALARHARHHFHHLRHLLHARGHLFLLLGTQLASFHLGPHVTHHAAHVVHHAGHLLRAWSAHALLPAHLAAAFLRRAGVHALATVHRAPAHLGISRQRKPQHQQTCSQPVTR